MVCRHLSFSRERGEAAPDSVSRYARCARLPCTTRSRSIAGLEGAAAFDPENDRVMLCGSTAMIRETAQLLEAAGLDEGSNANPGRYVIERAFVD